MQIKVANKTGKEVAERMMFLAWKACGGTTGMGFLQDRGSEMTEKQVIENINRSGDYPVSFNENSKNQLYADYVFGRMMKTRIGFSSDTVEIPDGKPRPDYQGWSFIYKTYQALVSAAINDVGAVEVK
jgi:hypothetical protein